MRKLCVSVLITPLLFIGAAASDQPDGASANPEADLAASRERSRGLDQALPRTAQWLLEQPDPRKRAAGLLYQLSADKKVEARAARLESLASGARFREHESIGRAALEGLNRAEAHADALGAFEPAELLERIEDAIRTTSDGAGLAWLASACATADIEAFCLDAGLDDAIVLHDGANLFSRLRLVTDAEVDTHHRLIIEAENTRNYASQLITLWFEALDRGPASAALKRPYDKQVAAFSVGLTYEIPGYQSLTRACRTEVKHGSELDRACDRIADRMISDSHTLIGRMIGLGLASARAQARDDEALAARLEQRKVYENAVQHCYANALAEELENLDQSEARKFMKLFGEHGEIEAYARLAADHGIDCSNPDDPAAEALEVIADGLVNHADED